MASATRMTRRVSKLQILPPVLNASVKRQGREVLGFCWGLGLMIASEFQFPRRFMMQAELV